MVDASVGPALLGSSHRNVVQGTHRWQPTEFLEWLGVAIVLCRTLHNQASRM